MSWTPKEVSPGERKMAQSGVLRPPRDSRSKILLLHLTVEQREARGGEETCSRSPSQWVAKLVTASPGLLGCRGPGHYLLPSYLEPGLLGTVVPTYQRWYRGSANVTQLGADRAGTQRRPPTSHLVDPFPGLCTSPLSPWDLCIEPAAQSRLARIQMDSG